MSGHVGGSVVIITGCSGGRRGASSRSGRSPPCGGGCGVRLGRSAAGKFDISAMSEIIQA